VSARVCARLGPVVKRHCYRYPRCVRVRHEARGCRLQVAGCRSQPAPNLNRSSSDAARRARRTAPMARLLPGSHSFCLKHANLKSLCVRFSLVLDYPLTPNLSTGGPNGPDHHYRAPTAATFRQCKTPKNNRQPIHITLSRPRIPVTWSGVAPISSRGNLVLPRGHLVDSFLIFV
jgi:hypothetical protein